MSGATQTGAGRFARAAGIALAWWRDLQPDEEGGDRAALARLRRAATLTEAMAEAATIDLWRRLVSCDPAHRTTACDLDLLPRVAAIAHVLAHARENTEQTVMRRVGRERYGDAEGAILKPIRFRRLLAARADDELMREMRRLVQLADRRLDVGHLAASLLFWSDATRARWAFDYFAARHATPSVSPDDALA